MPTAGYSGTPLVKKLGIRPGDHIALIHAPENYNDTLGELPAGITIETSVAAGHLDFVQAFFISRIDVETEFPELKLAIHKNGTLWISWPKKASKVQTDITETAVREIGLSNGLVDVKVAAVDAVWSGLKFVYRKSER